MFIPIKWTTTCRNMPTETSVADLDINGQTYHVEIQRLSDGRWSWSITQDGNTHRAGIVLTWYEAQDMIHRYVDPLRVTQGK